MSRYRTTRRRREVGLRAALGAEPLRIALWVVATGAAPVLLGTAIGVAAAMIGRGSLNPFLYGVEKLDPVVLSWVVLVSAALGLLGTVSSARRAMTLEPARELLR